MSYEKKLCDAKTSSGGKCNLPAGHQTIHPGVGRCKFHEESDSKFPFKYTSRKLTKPYGMCRSPVELKVFRGLNISSKVVSYTIEPFKILYYLDGKESPYPPDVLINYSDGSKKLVEIKTSKGYLGEENICKYKAAIEYSKTREFEFELWVCSTVNNRFQKDIYSGRRLLTLINENDT